MSRKNPENPSQFSLDIKKDGPPAATVNHEKETGGEALPKKQVRPRLEIPEQNEMFRVAETHGIKAPEKAKTKPIKLMGKRKRPQQEKQLELKNIFTGMEIGHKRIIEKRGRVGKFSVTVEKTGENTITCTITTGDQAWKCEFHLDSDGKLIFDNNQWNEQYREMLQPPPGQLDAMKSASRKFIVDLAEGKKRKVKKATPRD